MSDERISASRVIPAPADRVLAVLRDPDGHVAIDSSGMLQSAEGERVEQERDGSSSIWTARRSATTTCAATT